MTLERVPATASPLFFLEELLRFRAAFFSITSFVPHVHSNILDPFPETTHDLFSPSSHSITSPLAIFTNLNSRLATSLGTFSSPCQTSPSVQDSSVAADVSHELALETTEML